MSTWRPNGVRSSAFSIGSASVGSGVNFLTVVLLGRYAYEAELGVYALVFSVFVLITTGQAALLTTPYTVLRSQRTRGDIAGFGGSVWLASVGVAALASAIGVSIAGALCLAGGSAASAVLCAGLIAPFVLQRDLLRRVLFAWLRFEAVFAIDAIVGVIRLALLAWLAVEGRLDAMTALAAWGASDLVGVAVTAGLARRHLRVRREQLAADVSACWDFGRWSLTAQSVFTLQHFGAHWMLAALKGPAWVGLYTACATLAQLVSPVTTGLANMLGPVMTDRLNRRGLSALGRVIWRVTIALIGITLGYAALMAGMAPSLLPWLYGEAYAGNGSVVVLLAGAAVLSAAGLAASKAVTALERPAANVAVNAISLPFTLVLVGVGAVRFGLSGAAAGVLAGGGLTLGLRWWWVRRVWAGYRLRPAEADPAGPIEPANPGT